MKLSERGFRRSLRLQYKCRALDLCYNKARGNKKSRLHRYLSIDTTRLTEEISCRAVEKKRATLNPSIGITLE